MWTWRSWDWTGFFHHQKDEECFFGVEVIDLIPDSSRITLILPIINVSMYQLNLSKRGFVWLIWKSLRHESHHWLLQRFVWPCFGRDLRTNTVFWRVQWFLGPWYVFFGGGPKKLQSAPEVQLGPHVLPLREQARVLCYLDLFGWQPHVVLGVLLCRGGTFLGMKPWNLIFPWWFFAPFSFGKGAVFRQVPFLPLHGI